jgi:hypothetical protein
VVEEGVTLKFFYHFLQEDTYAEFLRIRKIPIEERPLKNIKKDIGPFVSLLLWLLIAPGSEAVHV